MNSISKQTLIPILNILVIGIAVVIIVTQQLSRNVVVEIVVMNTNETMSLIRKHLVAWIAEKQTAVHALSKDSRIGESLPDSLTDTMLRAGIVDILKTIKEETKAYVKISIADREGNMVMSSLEPETSENIAQASYFKMNPKSAKQIHLELNKEKKSMNLVLSEPLADKNKEQVGVLMVWIDLKTFEERFLKDFKLGKSGYLSLINQQNGQVIGIGDWNKRSSVGFINVSDYDWGKELLERNAVLKNGEHDELHFSLKEEDGTDRDKLITFQPISELGWIIAGEAYLDELTEKSKYAVYINLAIYSILLLVIAAILIVFLKHLVLAPIRNFTKVIVRAEQEGDFSLKTGISTIDELGQAAKALDSLMASLKASFQSVNQVMSNMANANLVDTIESEQKGDLDDLKNHINKSMQILNMTVSQLVVLTELIDDGTSELSDAVQVIAQGTSDQTDSLKFISSSITDVESQASLNTDNSSEASKLSAQTMEIISNGNKQLELMLHSMNAIHGTSQKVTNVIKVIDNIALQTDILALNASIEAARAGKYGKGFAVVADEVRNLANRSTQAAKEISKLIEESVKEIENGVKNADHTSSVLSDIQESVGKVDGLVSNIAAASAKQKKGIIEIDKALEQINSVVLENSSLSEKTAASSKELLKQSNEMRKLMARFHTKSQPQSPPEQEDLFVEQIEE